MADRLKRLPILPAFLACCGIVCAAETAALAPAINWMMSMFTRENYHSMTLRGSRATVTPASHQINVVDLNLTAFSGDAAQHFETIILSAAATFLPQESVALGNQGVRVIRDDLEATGRNWSYNHAQKKVSLHGHVRVVFNAELNGLLK